MHWTSFFPQAVTFPVNNKSKRKEEYLVRCIQNPEYRINSLNSIIVVNLREIFSYQAVYNSLHNTKQKIMKESKPQTPQKYIYRGFSFQRKQF